MKKYYDPKINRFCIEYDHKNSVSTYKTFGGFVKALDGNLDGADLRGCSFDGIQLDKYKYRSATIDIDVLKSQGLYDGTFYNSIVKHSALEYQTPMEDESLEHIEREASLIMSEQYEEIRPTVGNRITFSKTRQNLNIGYISDLHIDHDILREFPNGATKQAIWKYIERIVLDLVDGIEWRNIDYIIVCGDVSSNFQLTRIFYSRLAKEALYAEIIAILGNRELWGFPSGSTLDKIIDKYTSFFESERKIIFLQNSLFVERVEDVVIGQATHWQRVSRCYHQEELLAMSPGELSQLGKRSRFMIFGGIGFSGCNDIYNADTGLYRTVVTSEQDQEQSSITEKLHAILRNSLSSHTLIVATHMKPLDWTHENAFPQEWIYVWGHDHRNDFVFSDTKKFFADNQVGYHRKPSIIKAFRISQLYDLFEDYADGIHEITDDAYRGYYIGINIKMHFNSKSLDKIFLLKKNGYNMFLCRKTSDGKLLFLSGGRRLAIKEQNIDLVFKSLDTYASSLSIAISDYRKQLKKLSNEVISIGGSGKIHGCIVDIDWFNHLFFNPVNGHISAYSADSIVKKEFYENPLSLITAEFGNGFLKHLAQPKNDNVLGLPDDSLLLRSGTTISNVREYVPDTWHYYSLSRKMLDLDRIITHKTVRIWDESWVAKPATNDIGQAIMGKLLLEE